MANQSLFKYILETRDSDKLSLFVYCYIQSRRREQLSKSHIPVYVYFVVTFIPWSWILTIDKQFFFRGWRQYYLQSPVSNVKKKKLFLYERNSIQTQSIFYRCSAFSLHINHDPPRNETVFVYFSIKRYRYRYFSIQFTNIGRRLRVFYFNNVSRQDGEQILYYTSRSTNVLQRICQRLNVFNVKTV